MCELFALSSAQASTVQFGLAEFARRGAAGRNPDGWGVAYYVDGDVRLLKEPVAAGDSPCQRFLQEHPVRSALVLSHVRHATQGPAVLRNCQPFARELGGAMHVFAHNGDLLRAPLQEKLASGVSRPVGDTDSELAFCALLEAMRPVWLAASRPPALPVRLGIVEAFAEELRRLGPANFVYSDGDVLFAHGDRRRQDDGRLGAPGLHVLQRPCVPEQGAWTSPGLRIAAPAAECSQVVLASIALTGEADWRALREGEVLLVRNGRVQ